MRALIYCKKWKEHYITIDEEAGYSKIHISKKNIQISTQNTTVYTEYGDNVV